MDKTEDKLSLNEIQLPKLVNILKDMIQGDKKLAKKCRKDYEFLAKFIRVRSYDANRAFILIQKYYRNIEYSFEMMHNVKPSSVADFYHESVISALKRKDKLGCTVFVVNAGWNTDKFSIQDFQMASGFLAEEVISDKDAQINGVSAIIDMTGFSFQHVKQVTLGEIRRMLSMAQGGFPVKISSVHVINYSSMLWALYALAYRLVQAKIRQRIHFHNTMESLHQYFDPDMLPISLNGNLVKEDAFDMQLVTNLLENDKIYDEYFTEPSSCTVTSIESL